MADQTDRHCGEGMCQCSCGYHGCGCYCPHHEDCDCDDCLADE